MAHKLIAEEQRLVRYDAPAAGYKSSSTFGTEFKKYFGYTPGSLSVVLTGHSFLSAHSKEIL